MPALIGNCKPSEVVYLDRRIHIHQDTSTDGTTTWYARCYKGKAKNHAWFYRFPTRERMEQQIQAEMRDADADAARKVSRKADAAERRAAMRDKFKVGDLLCYSWGYEQTNVDFYQVVEKSGSVVTIRQIGAEMCDNGGGHSMSGNVRAVPNKFIGEPVRKVIGPSGISMDFGSLDITHYDKWHYCSWYA